jgi:hypothetical protein
MTGFFPRERDTERTWRWMGGYGAWTIVNRGATSVMATLSVELAAFHRPRRMELRLDGRPVQTLVVDPLRGLHEVGPLTLEPGEHHLAFYPDPGPASADAAHRGADRRPLSFAFGAWSWTRVNHAPGDAALR